MPARFRIAYLAHTIRSDWNNGNAHFLRGLLRALGQMGHEIITFEPEDNWSIANLRAEDRGERALTEFRRSYPDLRVKAYREHESEDLWRERLRGVDVVILHEWNAPELAALLLALRKELHFTLLFHDTHHRATSSPDQMARFALDRFDGVLAFGEALREIYRERYGLARVWTLHEAADTTIFEPMPGREKETDLAWIGNWGEGERTREIREFLLEPIASMQPGVKAMVYGVRYPADGLHALDAAGIAYGGYLPNLDAPAAYASARLTMHIPRQQYTGAMQGIPTIRVFEALACGIPLLSAPWSDTERLFREDDFLMVSNGMEMREAMAALLNDPERALEQAQRGRETVLARHTCMHRAEELTQILDEVRA